MTSFLHLAPELTLPDETVGRALAVVAQRGKGKTYLSRVLTEEFLKNGLPVAVIDPLGVYHGLALTEDGQRPAYPIAVLGGSHGHIPLTPENGRAVATFLVDTPRPVIVDLSDFRKAGQREFVTAFAEELYHRNRVPLHLVVDEADLFIPQRPQKGEERMLGAFEDVVRRGRVRGLGITMITQRPAVINKDVLTQVDALIMLGLSSPQDRKAVEAWINVQEDSSKAEKVLRELPGLPVGTGWFWSPGWMNTLRKFHVRRAETFDSSKTPKVGDRIISPQDFAPVDLEALRALLTGKKTKKGTKQKLVKLQTGSVYGKVLPRLPHPEVPRPVAVPMLMVSEGDRIHPQHRTELELLELSRRVEALAQTVERLAKGIGKGWLLETEAKKTWTESEAVKTLIEDAPSFTPSVRDGVDLATVGGDIKLSAGSHSGTGTPTDFRRKEFSQMEEELYQKFKARLAAEAPALLRLLVTPPEMVVTVTPKTIDVDDTTIQGRIAILLAEGFFAESKNGNQVYKELLRRGAKLASVTAYREVDELVTLGFLTKEKDGFRQAPRAKIRKAG